MRAKHAKICHFYAEIVKFGLIFYKFEIIWAGQTGGGGQENIWGQMPPCGAATGQVNSYTPT